MGTFTGNVIKTIRPANRGGDQLGPCEECGKPMSEAFVAHTKRVYKRDNGEAYTGELTGGIYGHASCLERFGPFTTLAEWVKNPTLTSPKEYAELMRKIDAVQAQGDAAAANSSIPKPAIDVDLLQDFVCSHGYGEATPEGLRLGEALIVAGDGLATAAAEIVTLGLTVETEEEGE
ncbi:hypothetical protein [Pseudomonas sp. NPDC089569]|uniref:hypothetical protein n=1 Tax=Pseudomonas sp. NPDC089569 TaxID=3390722 RepID=UPI003D07AF22